MGGGTNWPAFDATGCRQAGARIGLPQCCTEGAAYIAKGGVATGGGDYAAGQMLVFGRDAEPTIEAEEPATVMLLGGEPLGERFIWWNFVSSRKERIEQ